MTSSVAVNDFIKLQNGLKGYVEWIGEVEGEERLGIELKEWDENGNDGSFNGKFYFSVRGPGWGYFAKRSQVSKVLEKGKGRPDKIAGKPGSPRVPRKVDVVRDSETGLAVGDVVKLRNGKQGEIMYIGKTDFHKNKLIGLKLSNWSERGHDGTVKGKSYFKCHPGYGYFTKPDAVNSTLKKATASVIMVSSGAPTAPSPATVSGGAIGVQFGVGDKVKLKRGRIGIVKYIGKADFANGEEVVGLELEQWSDSGNDGSVKGTRYFTCSAGRGYFTKRGAVSEVLEMAPNTDRVYMPKEEKKPEPEEEKRSPAVSSGPDVVMGDFVRLRKGREGTVRYIGPVDGVKGDLIGLELQQWVPGKDHDGDYNGKSYYTCKSGTGYWTKRENISKVIQKGERAAASPSSGSAPSGKPASMRQRQSVVDFSTTAPPSETILDFKVGDKVKLKKGRVGVVKYYGKADFAKVPVVGLELDQWSMDGGDGTVKGKRYFECNVGRAYFTRPNKVTEIISRAGGASSAETDEAVFCGLWPGGAPTGDESPKEAAKPAESLESLPVEFGIGDKVQLNKGRIGIVRFYGKTQFAKGLVVGLELSEWSPTGGDGTVKGNQYFVCAKGRAYFTRSANVAKVLEQREAMQVATPGRRDSLEIKPDEAGTAKKLAVSFEMGDRVRLTRGRVGTVKFIGKTHISKDDVVGLELEQWSEKGNDGSVKGKRYFTTRGPGWGYFTKPENIAEVIHMP